MTEYILMGREGKVVGTHIRLAKNPWQRFLGLMGTCELPLGFGLILPRTNAVHGFFMRYPLRLVYLSRDKTVMRTGVLRPWTIGPWVRKAYYVVELPLVVDPALLEVGSKLSWQDCRD